jgi:hypothetical protein
LATVRALGVGVLGRIDTSLMRNLDRQGLLQLVVVSEVHEAEAIPAQTLFDLVTSDLLRQGGHGRGDRHLAVRLKYTGLFEIVLG